MGTLRWIFVSSLIVIFTLTCTFNLSNNYKMSNILIGTHMYNDTAFLNKTKIFTTSVKKRTIHMYTDIISEVSKVFVKHATTDRDEKKKLYITTKPVGRLGNQLFKYAVLFAITRTNHTWIPVILEDDNLDLVQNTFGTSLSIKIIDFNITNSTTIHAGLDADTTVKVLSNLPTVNLTLAGYFESHKYFAHVKDDLRKEFTFPRQIQDQVYNYFNTITPTIWNNKPFVRVGIHVRRTDQITEERQKMGYIPRPKGFYVHAMEYFKQKYNRVQIIVTSDDLAWCKENILSEHIEYSTHNYTIDFAILSLSDHIIISFGTYSWWAGWLCKGTTIYYGIMPPSDSYLGRIYKNNSCVPVPNDVYNNWVPLL